MCNFLKNLGRSPESITPRGTQQHRERVVDLASAVLGTDLTADSAAQQLGQSDTTDNFKSGGKRRVSTERAAATQLSQQNAVANARDAENTIHDVAPLKGRSPCQVQNDETRGRKRS